MARRVEGNVAPYEPKNGAECTWCAGRTAGTLKSESYNSCVGMVLYGPAHRLGVVAHFSGSMGGELDRAASDVGEILREVCPVGPGLWKAWVFGGVSLNDKTDTRGTVEKYTIPLIERVRETLLRNPYMPVNLPLLMHQKANFRQQMTMKIDHVFTKQRHEMNLFKKESVKEFMGTGHFGVELDLASGMVRWI